MTFDWKREAKRQRRFNLDSHAAWENANTQREQAAAERDAALAQVEGFRSEVVKLRRNARLCATCGKPAACLGVYENPSGPEEYACNDCCGHGNEDGWCNPISPAPAVYTREQVEVALDAVGNPQVHGLTSSARQAFWAALGQPDAEESP